jgi:hypothetical protein
MEVEASHPFLINDCDTNFRSSGGPLFVSVDGVLKLAALMIAGNSNR